MDNPIGAAMLEDAPADGHDKQRGSLEPGTTAEKDCVVTLEAAEYLYSCPLTRRRTIVCW